MSFVLGLDCSTQSLSAILLDAKDALQVAGEWQVRFGDMPEACGPEGYIKGMPEGQVHADPLMWLHALDQLLAQMQSSGAPLDQVAAVSGSGQQHGSVCMNCNWEAALERLALARTLAEAVKPCLSRWTAPIWMDHSTSRQCAEIASRAGGADRVRRISGSVPTERFTGPQIRAFSQRHPEAYEQTAHIHLVSSFLCSMLAGHEAPIDTGDGAGMNLMDLSTGDWSSLLVQATAPELAKRLPSVRPSDTVVGQLSPYFSRYGFRTDCRVIAWSGDNPSALVGMGADRPGSVVISLGTSDTLFAAMPKLHTDPAGCGHVFGNPLGGFMTLACFRNGSLAREAFRDRLDVGWDAFEAAGEEILPEDACTCPWIFDEITPRVGAAFREARPDLTPPKRIRAFLEAQARNMRDQLDWMRLTPDRLLLTGGASGNAGIVRVFEDVFGVPAVTPAAANAPALGAAMRAALAVGLVERDTLARPRFP